MTEQKAYRVLARTVEVRKSARKGSPDYQRFHTWRRGDLLTGYPSYTDIKGLLSRGAIEEVSGE